MIAQHSHWLKPHPDSPPTPVERIEVDVSRSGAVLALTFRVVADREAVKLPAPTAGGRADDLWRRTCFEAFVKGPDEAYFEHNLSPSSQWAAWRFDGYRTGRVEADGAPWAMECVAHLDRLEMRADLPLLTPGPWRLGLSAVIEDIHGRISWWALAHPSDKPDFHHPDSFVLDLP